jgi:hypothetical protein
MPLEISLNNNSSQTDKLVLKEATLNMVEVLALSSIEIYINYIIFLTIKNNNFTLYIYHQSKKRSSTSLFSSRFFLALTLL